jgi:acetyl esterase/lipase
MAEVIPGRVGIEEGVVFGTGGGRDLRCDVFTPPGATAGAPGVLLVHGGGWRQGDRTQLRGYGILLGRLGYVCVASEYRLTPEAAWPAQIHDVKAALRWMRANHERLGVDPQRIAISGNSAGGHLALHAAGTPGMPEFEGDGGHEGVSTEVAAAIAFYPPVTMIDAGGAPAGFSRTLFGDGATPDSARLASPLTFLSGRFPPTLLIHGTRDELVPLEESLRMQRALLEAGVPAELHSYADQPHGFDGEPRLGRHCADVMALFLERYVRERRPDAAAVA